jgi:glucokinase
MAEADRRDPVLLVADVGGTHVRFALACHGRLLTEPRQRARRESRDLAGACQDFLADHAGGVRIDGAAIAAAGRLQGERIEMTNADWSVDAGRLAGDLGLRRVDVLVLNDFGALARALPTLAADEQLPIPGGARALAGVVPADGAAHGHRVVVGPGTGLGVAALLRTPAGWYPLATEGGHASLAPESPLERAAADLAARRFGRASWERLLSGTGLALLHAVARAQAGEPPVAEDPAATVAACLRGEPSAIRAARAFVELLGAFAGDLALLYDAGGGVVIAGGIVPRIAEALPLDGLRTRFEAKGRFSDWLATVPLTRLATPAAALRGAALAWTDRAATFALPDPAVRR